MQLHYPAEAQQSPGLTKTIALTGAFKIAWCEGMADQCKRRAYLIGFQWISILTSSTQRFIYMEKQKNLSLQDPKCRRQEYLNNVTLF